MKKYLDAKEIKWYRLLLLALLVYTVKNIFVGADVDEGYGIMVGYRLATGDRLLLDMWEPHQTSALFTAIPIRLFLLCTGGSVDFLNIYLRVIFFLLHGLLAGILYKTLTACVPSLGKPVSALLATFFYVSSPKCIFIPEYSNLHIWFLTLLTVTLVWYWGAHSRLRGNSLLLVAAGVWMTCDVLAYPSMALLFLVCMVLIWCRENGRKIRACLLFAAPCVLAAVIFLIAVTSYMSVEQIVQVLPHVLGDGSHEVTLQEKTLLWGRAGLIGVCVCAVAALLAAAATAICMEWFRRRGQQQSWKVWYLFYLVIALVDIQAVTWLFGQYNATYLQLQYLLIPLLGWYGYAKTRKDNPVPEGKLLIGMALAAFALVLMLSNWSPLNLNTYLILGVVGGLLGMYSFFRTEGEQKARRLLQGLLVILVLGNAFGYTYRMIGGDEAYSTILDVRGYNHGNVRKGILTNYMTSYRYNQNLKDWQEAVPAGSKLMYVGMSQFYYMFGDCTVACPNTISTPTYDEGLLEYWEMNPERYPDVVALESWFGEVSFVEKDSFLMKWLEEDFRASEIIEYPYITVYRRK